jgi:hypothetical protein
MALRDQVDLDLVMLMLSGALAGSQVRPAGPERSLDDILPGKKKLPAAIPRSVELLKIEFPYPHWSYLLKIGLWRHSRYRPFTSTRGALGRNCGTRY